MTLDFGHWALDWSLTADARRFTRIRFPHEGNEGNKELLAQAKLKSAVGTKYFSLGWSEAQAQENGPNNNFPKPCIGESRSLNPFNRRPRRRDFLPRWITKVTKEERGALDFFCGLCALLWQIIPIPKSGITGIRPRTSKFGFRFSSCCVEAQRRRIGFLISSFGFWALLPQSPIFKAQRAAAEAPAKSINPIEATNRRLAPGRRTLKTVNIFDP